MQVRRIYKKHNGGGCPCAGASAPILKLPLPETFQTLGGNKNESKRSGTKQGGYRATKKDKKYLKMWKEGKSIGFTMRSSLKAKGLIPRANGTRKVSNKYK